MRRAVDARDAHPFPSHPAPARPAPGSLHDRDDPAPIGRRLFGRLAAGIALSLAAPAVLVRAQPATLRLTSIQSMTGPSSAYGWRARDGAQYAVNQLYATGISVAGTTYRLQVTVQDLANDPQQAITLLRQAASQADVLAIIGTSNSVGFSPSVPAAGQLQVPMVGAGSGAPIKGWNPYSFRVNPVSTTAIPVLVREVHKRLGFKKLAIVYDRTQDGQAGDARVAQGMAKELGSRSLPSRPSVPATRISPRSSPPCARNGPTPCSSPPRRGTASSSPPRCGNSG